MLALILTAVAVWFAVHWAFVAVMHAKAVRERGALSPYWLVMMLPLSVAAVVLDVGHVE